MVQREFDEAEEKHNLQLQKDEAAARVLQQEDEAANEKSRATIGAAGEMETCSTAGCGRATWNGEVGHCCKTCGETKGSRHGLVCEARIDVEEIMPPQPKRAKVNKGNEVIIID